MSPLTTAVTGPVSHRPAARGSGLVTALCLAVAALALVAGLAGLFLGGGRGVTAVTTLRGAPAELLGSGLYRYDTAFTGAGYRGTDAVSVFLAVPALLVCVAFYRRGSVRAALALTGVVAYFLYVYANVALGAAYNDFFLVYVALLGASFYALVLLLRSIDLAGVAASSAGGLPRRGPSVYFLVAGAATAFIWLQPAVAALASGGVPDRMDTSTTAVTYALDLALIVPACFVAAGLILRRAALGYVVAAALLGIIVFLGPGFVAQTVVQLRTGVEFTPGEVAGPIGGFGTVAALGLWVSVAILRRVRGRRPESEPAGAAGSVPGGIAAEGEATPA
jgi:hypothetical protein